MPIEPKVSRVYFDSFGYPGWSADLRTNLRLGEWDKYHTLLTTGDVPAAQVLFVKQWPVWHGFVTEDDEPFEASPENIDLIPEDLYRLMVSRVRQLLNQVAVPLELNAASLLITPGESDGSERGGASTRKFRGK